MSDIDEKFRHRLIDDYYPTVVRPGQRLRTFAPDGSIVPGRVNDPSKPNFKRVPRRRKAQADA